MLRATPHIQIQVKPSSSSPAASTPPSHVVVVVDGSESVVKPAPVVDCGGPRGGAHFVHLQEEKVFAQLGEREEHDAGAWICDTGATNHMSRSWVTFSEVDTEIRNTVCLGDEHCGVQVQEWVGEVLRRGILHSPTHGEHHQRGSIG
jgi:hypothetical protein